MSSITTISRSNTAPAFFDTIENAYTELVDDLDSRVSGHRFVVLGEDATLQFWEDFTEDLDDPIRLDRLEAVQIYASREDALGAMVYLKSLTDKMFAQTHEAIVYAANNG